jgi:hypothetical protein
MHANATLVAERATLFNEPVIPAIQICPAMRCKEAAAIFPNQRPNMFAISPRNVDLIDSAAIKECEATLAVRRWNLVQPYPDFEEEHEPMRLSLVTHFADDPEQMQILRRDPEREFFHRLPASASVRRFAQFAQKLAAGRTPQAEIGLSRPLHEQHFVLRVEAIEKRRDVVRQFHSTAFPGEGRSHCDW